MSSAAITIGDLVADNKNDLALSWVAGQEAHDLVIEPINDDYPGMALVGFLNTIHANRVQVIGQVELGYLNELNSKTRNQTLDKLFNNPEALIYIISDGLDAPVDIIDLANNNRLGLISTPLSATRLIARLQHYLADSLAPRLTIHGVYMEVIGLGVLILGESGAGKSEVALDLLNRNHRLIADDAVEFIRRTPNQLIGRCPEALKGYIEVRGLGILDVPEMFGDIAVIDDKRLDLVVRVEEVTDTLSQRIDRLQTDQRTCEILGVELPEVLLLTAPGRNLAILLEAAVRDRIIRRKGIDPVEKFIRQQQAFIDAKSSRDSSQGS